MEKCLTESNVDVNNLVSLVSYRATIQPDQIAYSFIENSNCEQAMTYSELDRRARSIAKMLQQTGRVGDRVLLIYRPGLDYITAFFGCLYAGRIAVPAYPPHKNRPMPRIQAIVADSKATVALTTMKLQRDLQGKIQEAADLRSLNWIATDTLESSYQNNTWDSSHVTADTLAFLQYTSGSTALPKGVMLTHSNLMDNIHLIQESFEVNESSKGVIWLPPYHDMGLIGGILTPLYSGFPVTLMAPVDFLQNPIGWLESISEKRATVSGGPNFAYELCIQKVKPEHLERLDLSSWDVAFNGAEPIRNDTMQRFFDTFKVCGFRKEAFYPCYGLAEATLLVSGGKKSAAPIVRSFLRQELGNRCAIESEPQSENTVELVSSGKQMPGQKIHIVDNSSLTEVREGDVGEIWVLGKSIAKGYWMNEEKSEETFRAYLADTKEGPFLRTGDLGFMKDGELFVTGRVKDLIIIRGRNYYPQDIELTVEKCHPALRANSGAAFSVEIDGEERLVVMQEIERSARRNLPSEEIIDTIRKDVADQHGVQVYGVVLLGTGKIPKTSSGKVQRHACKDGYINDSFDVITQSIFGRTTVNVSDELIDNDRDSGITEIVIEEIRTLAPDVQQDRLESFLAFEVSKILKVDMDTISKEQSLNVYGLDSLISVELINFINRSMQVDIPFTTILQGPSIVELATIIRGQLVHRDESTLSDIIITEQGEIEESPLSYGQQALWFLNRLEPTSTAYNISFATRIKSPIDVSMLKQALQALVNRHVALRSTYHEVNGTPVQKVHSSMDVDFICTDSTDWSIEKLDDVLEKEASRPFDLLTNQPLRIRLYETADEKYIMLICIHHIAIDFWSLETLVEELGILYNQGEQKANKSLLSQGPQYTDYVHWQAKRLKGMEGKKLSDYWHQQLAEELPILNLPIDFPRPPVQTYRGSSYTFQINSKLTEKIKNVSRMEGTTLYTTLLAAFQVLLHRYTGQKDILVGSPVANRNHPQLESMIGYLANPVVMRTKFGENMSFREVLKQVRETVLSALEHQEYPFSLLVEQLKVQRGTSTSPIFQAMFVLEKPHKIPEISKFVLGEDGAEVQIGNLHFESVAIKQKVAQFDLSLMMVETPEGLTAALQYNTDLFEHESIERMGKNFQKLISSIVESIEEPVTTMPLITEEENVQLEDWNNTHVDYPLGRCLHQLFEEQVEKTPDTIAVVFGDQQITYRDLNARANRLAHALRKEGVGPDTLVGVCFERSIEMVVALYGVLKAGGAYVPFDPSYPEKRLIYMLEDSNVGILLAQSHLVEILPQCGAKILYMDGEEAFAEENDENPICVVEPEQLAYMIYTSGSTGKPKGVLIEHRGICNHLLWMQEEYCLTSEDVVLQKTPFSFDVSVWEFFLPLISGARLVVAEPGGHQDPAYLLRVMEANKVTTVHFVPSMLQIFLGEPGIRDLDCLKRVICSGEALPYEVQERFFACYDHDVELHNLYGPTEASVHVTYWACQRNSKRTIVPIGKPIANIDIYILDEHMRKVPIGVTGELYLGGIGLARGYHNKAELTAEKFVPSPFDSDARLYKTGDLARYLPGGEIEYSGRTDHQIKIRGLRIELEEIEATLAEHPSLDGAVVLLREVKSGDQILLAYVIVNTSSEHPTHADLRAFAKNRLPEFMVPNGFIMLDAFPLSANGKVDRGVLADIDWNNVTSNMTYVAPRNEVEQQLVEIWNNLFSQGNIGITDNFFEIGGHSLLATQLVTRIRNELGIEIPIRAVFEAPTIEELARQYVYSHVNDEVGLGENDLQIVPIARDPERVELPLSYAQQRLWFLNQLDANSPAYNIPAVVHMTGELDVDALQKSFAEIIKRHESLRTTFGENDGDPFQLILSQFSAELKIIDLCYLTGEEQQEEMHYQVSEEAKMPFHLDQGPLMRTTLIKMGEAEHILMVTMHHIISDGWSISILIRELGMLYESIVRGQANPLSELTFQYYDYVEWQHKWLEGEVLNSQLDYWKKQLSGQLPFLQLPTNYPRPTIQTYEGATIRFSLPKNISENITTLSHKAGTTMFMTILAAFQTLLYRYSGQTDILIGSPIANRNRTEVESIIGFFVNTIVLRADLSGDPTFMELLSRVRENTLQAYAHQDVPFERIIEEIQPTRDLSRNPVFQVMFVLQNTPMENIDLMGLQLNTYDVDNGMAKFDLTLTMEETEAGLKGCFEYNTDLFEASTIERMIGHLCTLLESIVITPELQINQIPLLTEGEIQQIQEWNKTQSDYPENRCIHELFEEQVDKTPKNIAIVHGEYQLTYEQLNKRANQLAHTLRKVGVGPEKLVGICMDRSVEMVIAIYGVLKAGGAYVPVDPSYPQERIEHILADSGITVLLTKSYLKDDLPTNRVVVYFMDDDKTFANESSENLTFEVSPEHLAYMIYTSGSTGLPKGVLIEHRSLVNYIEWSRAYYFANDEESPVFSLHSSIAFDLTVTSIFVPLSKGGSVIVYSGEFEEILSGIDSDQLNNAMKLTPAHLAYMMHTEKNRRSVRTYIVGGEALNSKLVKQLFEEDQCNESDGDLVVYNEYGPTESTVGCSVYEINNSNVSEIMTNVSIGRPIANTELYVLDAQLQYVPIGVVGELYIGGAGLARGYHKKTELTAEKFIANPFSNRPGDRLYRTGDLVRYLPNGEVEYLGRLDNQVKLRGYRIELGEIEAVLTEHPDVQEAVVLLKETVTGDKLLVAYLVTDKSDEYLSSNELIAYTKEKLPEYMIPTSFIILESFPLSTNGKVDRHALTKLEWEIHIPETTFVAPRNKEEQCLVEIWSELLGQQNIGVMHNFFEVGGHSLLATQLVSRIRKEMDIEIPLQAVFEMPTIAELVEHYIDSKMNCEKLLGAPEHSLVPIPRDSEQTELSLSFAQKRLWFLQQLQVDSTAYNIAAAIQLDGKLHVDALQRSFDEIIDRHESLRTIFGEVKGRPYQKVLSHTINVLATVDLRDLSGEEQQKQVDRLIREEARKSFDLNNGPLLRTTLLQTEDEKHMLLVTMHHIISDGWSSGILIRELAILYKSFVQGRSASLPDLDIQYYDYAEWQRKWLEGGVQDVQLDYWKKQLQGELPIIQLPTDYPRPSEQTYRGAIFHFSLSKKLSEDVMRLSHQFGTTQFMTLLAAFQTLLYRYSGQTDILIGSPVANRNREELESIIGFFVNTLVLRINLEGEPSFSELLQRVREVTMHALSHQDMPFEQVIEHIQPTRDLSRNPIFQVMFVLQNMPTPELDLEGLHLSPYVVDNGMAKFDLTLTMEETEAGLKGFFEYNTDLFNKSTIERMVGHFTKLLEEVTIQPELPITQLHLLTGDEQKQLQTWNNTNVEYPLEKCLHQLFEEQVMKTPDAIAIVCGEEKVSYQELNKRSNQVAHTLRKAGIGPDKMVGICMERSVEMVVALYGVLKAGGAYVPIDPSYPQDRLIYILEDAQVKVLLTQSHLVDILPPHEARLYLLDDKTAFNNESKENLSCEVKPEHLAYMIYTSGSTGKPKGVLIEHRGICNRLWWMQEEYQLTYDDVVLQKTPFSFDVSVWEFFWPLLFGSRLVVAKPEGHQDPKYLVQTMSEQQVTTIHFVPSMLQVFLEETGVNALSNLKRVICSGEALSYELQERFFARLGSEVQLHNLYGPTEASVDVTHRACVPKSKRNIVPIGRPISNIQIHLLDKQMKPVPIGVVGELHIGGIGLARGYNNKPEQTAEKFVPNPMNKDKKTRLYKTGDLGRYLPDGEIEYLGRIDHQVKIRGFRIEMGEIEYILVKNPNIREAVVVAHGDQTNDKRLVAYIVPYESRSISTPELRNYLKEVLPDYMIPSFFVQLDVLPLSSNGKVDRSALPEINLQSFVSKEIYVAPSTVTEKYLANIWSEVLGVKKIGLTDNFFEIGGDSIISIQMVSKANEAGYYMTPKDIFKYPTIAELAQVISTDPVHLRNQEIIDGESALTPIQQYFFESNYKVPDHWNQTLLLKTRSDMRIDSLVQAVQHVLNHHDAFRQRFVKVENGWECHYVDECFISKDVIKTIDLSNISEQEQLDAIEKEADILQNSLNLSEGPIVSVAYFNLGEGQSGRLLIISHHLAVDGVSWRILVKDMEQAYQQIELGKSVQLLTKTTSYKAWAELLNKRAQTSDLEKELEFWLDDIHQGMVQIPTDKQGENTEAFAESVTVWLGREQTEILVKVTPQAYSTKIQELLVAALGKTINDWSEGSTIQVDVEAHGREQITEDINLVNTVGWFTSIFPLSLNLTKNMSSGEAIQYTKETMRKVPNGGIGYGMLRYLAPELIKERMKMLPKSDVLFNYLGRFDELQKESQWFTLASESVGRSRSLKNDLGYKLIVNGAIVNGQLKLEWIYSQSLFEKETIHKVAETYMDYLQKLIEHCQDPQTGGYTPCDFPLAQIKQEGLDKLISQISQKEGTAKGKVTNLLSIYDLSPMQQGMLFSSLLEPESGVYIQQFHCTLEGNLQVEAFWTVWKDMLKKHDILRTAFYWEELQQPVQVVFTERPLPYEYHDWRSKPAQEIEEDWNKLLLEDSKKAFNYSEGPLLRLYLIRSEDNVYRFIFTHHHLLLDGWSVSLLFKEVFSKYTALANGDVIDLNSATPYSRYVEWLQSQTVSESYHYWKNELQGFETPNKIWLENTLPETGYATEEINIKGEVAKGLKSFAKEQQMTLSTIVQGAWALVLSRYSGENNVTFGVTFAGRPPELAKMEEMVGLFINTLPLCTHISPTQSLSAWLRELQTKQLEMQEYVYTPLMDIQTWSDIPQGMSLFDSVVVFENYPIDESLGGQVAGLNISHVHFNEQTNYPITITVAWTKHDELLFKISYDRSRFKKEDIEGLLVHVEMLLKSFVVNPEQKIVELPSLTPFDQNRLVAWNQTENAVMDERMIHQLLEDHAQNCPDAIVVVDGLESISYHDLNSKANQLARYLRELNVEDKIIAVFMEKSIDLIVAIFAINKAGAAYLPLDPSYPKERLDGMIEDCQPPIILTKRLWEMKLPKNKANVICIDTNWDKISLQPQHNLGNLVKKESLAYMIFTSGSTGRPKGVMVQHDNLINVGYGWLREYELDKMEVNLLQIVSPSFDVFTGDLMRTMVGKGKLVLCPNDVKLDIPTLYNMINEQQISIVESTPALLLPLMEYVHYNRLPLDYLKLLILGSDTLLIQDYKTLLQRFANKMRIINSYGITETTIDSSYYEAIREEELLPTVSNNVPIGKPFPNTYYYVLDDQLNQQPIGVLGELYIGGKAVARGYFEQADLTQERFVTDPFVNDGRMYKTGDLARWTDQGVVEFFGRTDNQIKIRGFRIELGEIENVLIRYPGIKKCIIDVHDDGTGNKAISAYVVTDKEPLVNFIEKLRQHLNGCLPAHIVPTHVIEIEKIPLTDNGKVDRRSLPAPVCTQVTENLPPSNESEVQLIKIWSHVLGTEVKSIDKSFFELGGNSLLLLRLFNAIQQELKVTVTVADLFTHHTIRMFSEHLKSQQVISKKDDLETIMDDLENGEISIVEARQRMDALK